MKIRPTNRDNSSIGAGVKHLRLDDDYTLTASDWSNSNLLGLSCINNDSSLSTYQEPFTVVTPIHTVWYKKFLLHCANGSEGGSASYFITNDRYSQSDLDMGQTHDYLYFYAGPDGDDTDAPILLSSRQTTSFGGGRG